ncbi:MAG: hypothetical protein R3190_15770, partial [Thermoanaerobaculia bacterium]|nr:hypothetical protein [Thermoanaerobaculia bacterium]
MKTKTILFASLLAAMLGSQAGAANRAQEPGYLERIDVTVVNVEAVVTDRQGIRVPNLRADDFRLFVDGEETPIDFFSEIRGGDVVAASAAAGRRPGVVEGEPVGTSYLVFIDEFFTIAADRRRVIRALADELGWLGPQDRMAIVAWDGVGLEMLSTWSRSPRELEQALRVAADRPSGGLQRLAELRAFESDRAHLAARRARLGSPFGSALLDPEEQRYVSLLDAQLENAVAAAAATLRGFAAPDGRKVMLLLNGSWSDRTVEYALVDP